MFMTHTLARERARAFASARICPVSSVTEGVKLIIVYLMYLLTAIGLSPGGKSTVHIYTQTIHRTIQNKEYTEHNNFARVRAVPRLG